MPYPDFLSLNTLEKEHPDFSQQKAALESICLLYDGGWRLNEELDDFLPRRVGEELEIYNERILKFSYINIFSSAIRSQVSRMTSAAIHVDAGISADDTYFDAFRDKTDGKGRSEKDLISNIFRDALLTGVAWLHIDRPVSPVPLLNRAQEAKLGLEPYVCQYSYDQVPDWGDSESGDLAWVKVRQVFRVADPLSKDRTRMTYKLIDRDSIAIYSAIVEIKDGKILGFYKGEGFEGESLITDRDEKGIPLVSLVAHGLGVLPIVRLSLPSDLFVGDEAGLLAKQHLRLSCHSYDLQTCAFFQRYYNTDPAADLDFSATGIDDSPPQLGLQFIPKLSNFAWSEPRGDILIHIASSLDRIEAAIRAAIAMTGASASDSASVAAQSGVSKVMDYAMSGELLETYGALLTDTLQKAYRLIQRFRGINTDLLSVSCLSDFQIEGTDALVAQLVSLSGIDMAVIETIIPPEGIALIRSELIGGLVGNLTPAQKADLEKAAVDFVPKPVPAPAAIPTQSAPIQPKSANK